MKSFRRIIILAVIGVTLLSAASSFADDDNSGNVPSSSGPCRKLGRGFCGAMFGVFEIPVSVWDVNKEEGALASWTYGLARGIGRFLAREGVGVFEIITFPMPLPGCTDDPRDSGWGYGPIMRPEWIIDTQHNAFNLFYEDTAVMN